jgi:hypothetical protein
MNTCKGEHVQSLLDSVGIPGRVQHPRTSATSWTQGGEAQVTGNTPKPVTRSDDDPFGIDNCVQTAGVKRPLS